MDQTIPGGNDDAAGNSALASVKTLEQALWLVQPNGTIVCMSMCSDTYHKESDASTYTFDGKNATIKRWNKYLSGPYFYIDKGVNLSLTNLTLSNTTESGGSAADSVVTLADGTLTAGTGLAMDGPVYFEQRPTASGIIFTQEPTAPYAIKFASNVDPFTSAFDAASAPETITAENLGRYLALDGSVNEAKDPRWALRVKPGTGNERIMQAYPIVTYTAIYLSGTGDDNNDGATANTPVATFARAKELLLTELKGNGVIYICGSTVTVTGEETWSLPPASFPSAKVAKYSGFTGPSMVSVARALTIADITFESDKTILQTSVDTALLKITSGTKLDYTGTDTAVTLSDGTASMTGGEIVGTSEKGTGVSVKGAATFEMSAGSIDKFAFGIKNSGVTTISGTAAVSSATGAYTDWIMTFSNAAISGSSCGVEIASGGKFIMESGTVSGASGKQAVLCSNGKFDMYGGTVTGGTSYGVMLSGTSAEFNLSGGTVSALNPTEQSAVYANSPGFTLNAAAATVNGRISLPDPTYVINLSGVPGVGKTFDVAVGPNHTSGVSVVVPTNPLTDASSYEAHFILKNYTDKFTIGGYGNDLILLEIGIYLDGVNGNDGNTGLSPAQAVKTFAAAKEKLVALANAEIEKGNTSFVPHIFLCGEVTVSSGAETWDLSEVNAIKPGWMADIRRFTNQYFKPVYLVQISGGSVTLSNIVVDGLRDTSTGLQSTLDLFQVTGGSLTLRGNATLQGAARNAVQVSGGSLTVGNGALVTGNGRTNSTSGTASVVVGANGTFTMNGGRITNNKAYNAVVLSGSGARFELHGGEISKGISGTTSGSGVRLGAANAVFDMDGGTISGFQNTGNYGGGVRLFSGAEFNMSGGTITNNSSGSSSTIYSGGGVYVPSGAAFNLSGGALITGNTAPHGVGGGVYIASGANFSMTGGHIRGNTAAESGSNNIYSANAAKFEMGGAIDINGGVMLWDDGAAVTPITLTGTLSQLTPPAGAVADGTMELTLSEYYLGGVVVDGGSTYNAGQYLNAGDIQFTLAAEPAKTMRLLADPDAAATPSNIVAAGWNVYISGTGSDADGYGWGPKKPVQTFARAKELIQTVTDIPEGGEANILVCGTVNVTASSNGGTWTLNDISVGNRIPVLRRMRGFTGTMVSVSAGELTLQNITIDGNAAAGSSSSYLVSQSAGTLTIVDGALLQNNRSSVGAGVNVSGSDSHFSMTGGKISGNNYGLYITNATDVVQSGGNITGNVNGVYLSSSSSQFSMTGGTISGNKSSSYGGGVYVKYGRFTLDGGTISGNTANSYGGGVYVDTPGTFIMSTGTISQNTAGVNGGGVYSKGFFTMDGGTISGNTATTGGSGSTSEKNGGGVYIYSGESTMSGGTISDNTVNGGRGGGVYIFSRGSFTMSGGTISQNTAIFSSSYGGGGGVSSAGTFTMSGGTISRNTTDASGGGVSASGTSATFTMGGGTISGNSAGWGGGGVHVYYGRFTMNDGTISENTGTHFGGGVFITDGTATMNGGTISQNTTGGPGGGVYCRDTFTMNSGTISENTAGYNSRYGDGGGVYCGDTFTMNGGTISKNIANGIGEGGGLCNASGTATITGGEITGNTAGQGAGCYCSGSNSTTTFKGGRVSGNILSNAAGKGKGVYVATPNFILEGGGADLADGVYLSSNAYPIKLSRTIRQAGRRYNVELATPTVNSTNGFRVGDSVVIPEGTLESAAPNLRYFATDYEGAVLDRGTGNKAKNIVLKKIIFVDGVKGNDQNDGSTPDLAYKTFAAAKKALGSDPGNIYICGKLTVSAGDNWSLGADQSLRRYSGFAVAGKYSYTPYRGDMIEVTGGTLTLGGIAIQGRHDADQGFTADGSIIKVNGGNVTMGTGTTLENNTTTGNGGAVNIVSGTLTMNGGTIENTQAAKGGAIYQGDKFLVGGAVSVEGGVYLAGGGNAATSKYIELTTTSGSALSVDMADAYAGRAVVQYPSGKTPDDTEKAKYTLAPDILAQYKLNNRSQPAANILELQEKGIVYIDGVGGSDDLDGTTPDTAVLTLKHAYELLKEQGGVIYVVDNVPVTGVALTAQQYKAGTDTVSTGGPVVIRRYSVPTNPPADGFSGDKAKRPYTGALFTVNGAFELSGVTIDGHSAALNTGSPKTTAPAVAAQAPLIEVGMGGALTVGAGAALQNNNNVSATNFGGAVGNDGTFKMIGGAIADTQASKGAAVYQNGTFYVESSPSIEGEIYLAGSGGSAKVISAADAFAPANALLVNMDGAENGRDVVDYASNISDTDLPKRAALYTLADEIAALYTLGRKNVDNSILELQAKNAIYINGKGGDDGKDGQTPANAVRTLKTAFDKLKALNGGTLYVVNTVDVSSARIAAETGETGAVTTHYSGEGGSAGVAGAVLVKRYAQPDNISGLTGFGVADNQNALFNVTGSLTLDGITLDGHAKAVTSGKQEVVADGVTAKAPLIVVAADGLLTTDNGARLQNNANSGDGGAVANSGTFRMDGGTITGNRAANGAGVWQNGTFRLGANAPTLGADQTVYLTAGADRKTAKVINVDSALESGAKISVDMDRTTPPDGVYEAGRDVAVFAEGAASYNDVANDAARFALAKGITEKFALVKSATEQNTLELGLPFHFTTTPDDMFVRVGEQVTFTADVSTSGAANVKLIDSKGNEMKFEAVRDDDMAQDMPAYTPVFRAVVRSNNESTSTVSFTFRPEAGSRAGKYYLTATDANGVTAKSEAFVLSLYEASTLTAKSTEASAEKPNASTGTLTVYNGYGVDKTVTSTGVGLSEGMGILLGMDTPTIGFATAREIDENFKLWTADDAMYKFNFKVDGTVLAPSTVLSGMQVPANGSASWTVTLKNANALNAAQTKKLLIKECKIGETPLTGLSSGGASMLGLDVPTAANMEVPFETKTARLDVTVPLSITVCVAKDGTLAQPSADRMYVENRSAFPVNTQVKPMLTRLAADSGDAMRQIDAPKIGEGTGYDLAIRPIDVSPQTAPIAFKTSDSSSAESRGLVIVVFQDFAEIPWNQKCTFDFLSNKMPSGQGENGRPANYSYQITFKASIAGEPQMGVMQ
ncbi:MULTISPECIES: beta strand repeat-containing protein [Anaerotruncus]|uniref:beta strand repeat-containing protein n=1 Tax=Anaerotruncus TaxID=244127 RepID=UPI001A9C03AE|nr:MULTISPECIES: right-handed parallel beta-helix repeat-containing protein [Anaerotruncus]